MTQPTLTEALRLLAEQMETMAKCLRAMSASLLPSCSPPVAIPDKPKSLLPTSPESQRLSELFSRRLTTAWSDKEIRAFKAAKPTLEDIEMVADYYEAERAKPDGIHRRDLQTCVNNWQGEVDRARAFAAKQKPAIGPYVDPVAEAMKV